jgi:hypothetical protein
MGQSIRWPHLAAISIACAAVGYQTAVIWETLAGVSTVTKLGVPLATISAALLPVLSEAAWRGGERIKGLLLFLPVAVLLAFVLPSGVSRLGEAQQARREAAQAAQGTLATTKANLMKAEALVAEATQWAAAECASGKGKKCDGQTFTLNQRTAYRDKLKADLKAAEPTPTPWLPDWHPATLPIGLELAAWAALFFGLGPMTHTQTQTVARPVQAITEREEPFTPDELEELRQILLDHKRKHGGKGFNNNTVADLIGVSPGESSKRVRDAAACGLVTKVRNGREVLIQPVEGVTIH